MGGNSGEGFSVPDANDLNVPAFRNPHITEEEFLHKLEQNNILCPGARDILKESYLKKVDVEYILKEAYLKKRDEIITIDAL